MTFFREEHEMFRKSVQDYLEKEVVPHVDEWERAESFPREVFQRCGELGFLGAHYPEDVGGSGGDWWYAAAWGEALVRSRCAGLAMSLMVQSDMATPIIGELGTREQKDLFLAPALRGEKIAALAITEPGGGSDVAALRTTAVRDGDHYIVDGEKTFITSGLRADFLSVAVRTDSGNRGAGGVSLLLVEGDTPGLSRTPLKKMGWWASDTAHLRFDNCRVPVANLIGAEGKGFKAIMHNFNHERALMATLACMYAQVCSEEALDWARQRQTFGAPLAERQVIRHKLVDMATRVETARALVYDLTWRLQQGLGPAEAMVARTCMAKIVATQAMQFCADQAVQILGGMGFMRGTKSERIYREVKVMMIGGGSEEIMKDLAARQLGV